MKHTFSAGSELIHAFANILMAFGSCIVNAAMTISAAVRRPACDADIGQEEVA